MAVELGGVSVDHSTEEKEDPLSRGVLYPKPLKRGDLVVVVSPSDGVDAKDLASGAKVLESWGLRVVLGYGVGEEIAGFMAGSAELRRKSMRMAIGRNPGGILIGGGGYAAPDGAAVFAEKWVKEALTQTRPVFMGYSDTGSLAREIYKNTGLVTWSGPHVGGLTDTWDERTIEDAKAALFGAEMSIGPGEDWKVVQKGVGKIEKAVLIPMNLDTINTVEWGFLAGMPKVLAIEECEGTWPDARRHLSSAWNRLGPIAAVIMGRFEGMKEDPDYRKWSRRMTPLKLLRDVIGDSLVPIVEYARLGHPDEKKKNKGLMPMMVGAEVELQIGDVGTGNCHLIYKQP